MDIKEYSDYLDSLTPVEKELELKVNRNILTRGGKVKNLPKKVYHLSPVENRESIMEKGLVPSVESAIFTSPNLEDCLEFLNSSGKAMSKAEEYDIWEITTHGTVFNNWYVNVAYDLKEIKAKSLIYFDQRILPFMLRHKGVYTK